MVHLADDLAFLEAEHTDFDQVTVSIATASARIIGRDQVPTAV